MGQLDDASNNTENFPSFNCEGLTAEAQSPECWAYASIFQNLGYGARAAGDESKAALFFLLTSVCRLSFEELENLSQNNISNDNLTTLENLLRTMIDPEIVVPDLVARIADILVLNKCGNRFELSTIATKAYLQSADKLAAIFIENNLFDEKVRNTRSAEERLLRARTVAISMGKNNLPIRTYIKHLTDYINTHLNSTEISILNYVNAQMDILVDLESDDNRTFIQDLLSRTQIVLVNLQVALDVFSNSEDMLNYDITLATQGRYYLLQARIYHYLGDETAKRQAFLQHIDTWVSRTGEQEKIIHLEIALSLLNDIGMRPVELRELGGFDEKREQILMELATAQRWMQNNPRKFYIEPFASFLLKEKQPTPEEIARLRMLGRETVAKKSFTEGVTALLELDLLPHYDGLTTKISPLEQSLTPTVTDIHNRHKAVAQGEGNNLEAYKLIEASRQRHLYAQAVILEAIEELKRANEGRVEIPEILLNSPFIPPDRLNMVEASLKAIIAGDDLAGTHVLIPQIEASLRHVLILKGAIPSNLSVREIEESYRLEHILYQYKDQLTEIFGSDTVFNLQGLLINEFGDNFRNRLMHGMVTKPEFFQSNTRNANALYLLWLTLNLCKRSSEFFEPTDSFIETVVPKPALSKTPDRVQAGLIDHMEGKSLYEKLRLIDAYFQPPYRTDLEMQAKGLLGDNPTESELETKMFELAKAEHLYTAESLMIVRQFITDEIGVKEARQIAALLDGSLFIKKLNPTASTSEDDRLPFWVRGIVSGLQGNGVLTAHILIPQIEESLRFILEQNGIITSRFMQDLSQPDFLLNKILNDYEPQLSAIIGANTVFDLKGLFSQNGSDLRNRMAHGLMSEEDFGDPEIIYLWWLALKLALSGKPIEF